MKVSLTISLLLGLSVSAYAFAYPNGPVMNHVATHVTAKGNYENTNTATDTPDNINMTMIMTEIAGLTNSMNQTADEQSEAMISATKEQISTGMSQAADISSSANSMMASAILSLGLSMAMTASSFTQIAMANGGMTAVTYNSKMEEEEILTSEEQLQANQADINQMNEMILNTNSSLNELLMSVSSNIENTATVISEMETPYLKKY